MCFVWISEQTVIISLYSINWLVFITERKCVYCAVRTGSLYVILRSAHTAVFMCFVCISEQTAIISLHSINWLVFINEEESIYCAVRSGSSNKTDTVSSSRFSCKGIYDVEISHTKRIKRSAKIYFCLFVVMGLQFLGIELQRTD
jgi:hypothetical protein